MKRPRTERAFSYDLEVSVEDLLRLFFSIARCVCVASRIV